MGNLAIQLSNYISAANEAMAMGDYIKAQDMLLCAAQCTLMLAKESTGAVRDKYLKHYQSLKELLVQTQEKITQAKAATATPAHTSTPTELPNSQNADFKKEPSVAPATENAQQRDEEKEGKQPSQQPASLSPQWLSDYIGQPQAVTAVRDLITAARLKNAAMPHLILYGSHGLGKTTFAKIIANEMRVGFTEINVTKITQTEMIALLKKMRPREILFIDEIHTLPTVVAESLLYSAMQDGKITYTEGKGKFAKAVTMQLPPFTLIGATTEIGKLAKPFTQRAIQIRLEEYTDEILARIISGSFYRLGMKINEGNALCIAKRCRNNPRIANSMVKRISDKALVRFAAMHNITDPGKFVNVEEIRKANISIDEKVIVEFFEENGIDEFGLENGDRELLKMIIHRYEGGPVGIDTLARAMNESNNVIAQRYEAYLIKKGMLRIDKDGRVVMPAGYKAVGEPVPSKLLEESTSSAKEPAPDKNPKYEKRKIIASQVPDALKCEKIEKLIVYPENVREMTQDLAEMFEDVEKPCEEETKHCCELEIDFDTFKRTITCDSFLESRFATCMATVGYLKDIKAQTLEIAYISQALANRRYFPDFVIRDYKNRIAVIEMKNFAMLTYHLNLDKYEKMREYCQQNGYGYAEIAKEFNGEKYTSLEQLRLAPINRQLESYIFETIAKKGETTGVGEFTEEDFKLYNEQFGDTDRKQLYTVLINNRMLKNIDRVGDHMKIVLND